MTHSLPLTDMVLDTNVVLDWLVFRDPAGVRIGDRIRQRAVRWLATMPMQMEFQRIMKRGLAACIDIDRSKVDSVWLSECTLTSEASPYCGIRSADPSDQMFIDHALQARAQWLITRDKALLRLARRAAAHGLSIVTPSEWVSRLVAREIDPQDEKGAAEAAP